MVSAPCSGLGSLIAAPHSVARCDGPGAAADTGNLAPPHCVARRGGPGAAADTGGLASPWVGVSPGRCGSSLFLALPRSLPRAIPGRPWASWGGGIPGRCSSSVLLALPRLCLVLFLLEALTFSSILRLFYYYIILIFIYLFLFFLFFLARFFFLYVRNSFYIIHRSYIVNSLYTAKRIETLKFCLCSHRCFSASIHLPFFFFSFCIHLLML